MKRVLTIGPSDSSGATGIQADLRVFERLGVTGLTAVTAVLAVEEGTVRRAFHVPPRVVEAQIDAVARGGVDATKVAALYDRTLVDAIAERVRRRRLAPMVLDPGIVNARGERLLGRNGVDWLRRRLFPQTALLVLDRAEAEILAGAGLDDEPSLRSAAEHLRRAGAATVLLLGGPGAAAWLADADELRPLELPAALQGGARDRFTAALTTRLALGDTGGQAAEFAAGFVTADRKGIDRWPSISS